MNVLILNWRDPKHPLAGGAEIALLEHAKYWQKKGASITWFASSFKNAKEEETVDGIAYIRKGSHYSVHLWAYIFFLLKRFEEINTVVDCFHFLPFFTPIYINRKKIIALIHEVAKEVWFQNMPWVLAKIGYHIEPMIIRIYKGVQFITVSNSTKDDLEQIGISSKKITVIHNGTFAKKFQNAPREKYPTVLFLGRVSRDKGIKDALDAYKLLSEKFTNLQFWIVGKEEKKGMLQQILKNKNMSIKYFGYVDEKKKFELLQRAWILIHPSVREGWGLSVIEANSVGTPVVGYNVPGLKDAIVHNKTGLLVNPSYIDLGNGVETLLKDKNLYRKLSSNSKKWSRKFSWNESTKKSWTMLQSL